MVVIHAHTRTHTHIHTRARTHARTSSSYQDGCTALLAAAREGKLSMLRVVVEAGADMDMSNEVRSILLL